MNLNGLAIKTAAEYYNYPVEIILTERRFEKAVLCKFIAIYIIRKITKRSLNQIGYEFGYRSGHSQSIHAIKDIEHRYETSSSFRVQLDQITHRFKVNRRLRIEELVKKLKDRINYNYDIEFEKTEIYQNLDQEYEEITCYCHI